MAQPHLAGLAVEVTAENWAGRLMVCSALDGSVTNQGVPRYRALASQHLATLEVGQIMYHPQSGWFDEGPQRGPIHQGDERASRPSDSS
jgi:trehalose/maltose hydrolase-like predicted phosphorylase